MDYIIIPNFVLPVKDMDMPLHTDAHPFCGDTSCPCYGDRERKRQYVEEPLLDGLLTEDEAVRIFAGKQV